MGHRRRAIRVLIAVLATAGAGLCGCGRADLGGPRADSEGSGVGAPALAEAPVGPPVTDEECRAFAATIEDAVLAGDVAAFNALIDWDATLETAMAGIEAPEASRRGFIQGVKSSMKQEQGIVSQIIATIKGGGSYKLLHIRARDKRKTALFRLAMPDGDGVNYHEFVLSRRRDGKVRAVDAYIFISGELMSQAMRRMYLPAAAEGSHGLFDRLLGTEKVFMKNLPRFQRMTAEVRAGRPAEALEIFRQLPPELQKNKNILMVRLQAAQAVGDEDYSRALEDLRAAHPDDACIDMISIDYYLLKKDYPRAFACLDRLDKAVGGDPYVNVMRAGIHTDEKQYGLAKQDARKAIEEDPTIQDAFWTLVTISLEERNFADTVTLLDQLEGRFHIPFGDITALPVFAEFVRSPEYRAWKDRPRPPAEAKGREPEAPRTGQDQPPPAP
jgi:tetratricopeptide (TPR) repeat protein